MSFQPHSSQSFMPSSMAVLSALSVTGQPFTQQKLAEMPEVLQARKSKLVTLSGENNDLLETNAIIRSQITQLKGAREAEIRELTRLIGEADWKLQAVIREKEMKIQLTTAQEELSKRAKDISHEKLLAEKDQQTGELLLEGKKLSKQQLQSNNIIKNLRAKKENDSLIASLKKKLEQQAVELEQQAVKLEQQAVELEQQAVELEHLRKVCGAKDDLEKKQTEAIGQLNAVVQMQEKEMAKLKEERVQPLGDADDSEDSGVGGGTGMPGSNQSLEEPQDRRKEDLLSSIYFTPSRKSAVESAMDMEDIPWEDNHAHLQELHEDDPPQDQHPPPGFSQEYWPSTDSDQVLEVAVHTQDVSRPQSRSSLEAQALTRLGEGEEQEVEGGVHLHRRAECSGRWSVCDVQCPEGSSAPVASSSSSPAVCEPRPCVSSQESAELSPLEKRQCSPPRQQQCRKKARLQSGSCVVTQEAREVSSPHSNVKTVHEGLRKYPCPHCQYRTGRKFDLQKHIDTVHEGLRKYPCPQCPHRAGHKSNLQTHIDTVHDGLRKYSCPHCQYRAGQKGHLQAHIDTVHEDLRKYSCPHCQYRDGQKCHLQTHINTVHDGLRKYPCPHCQYRAGRKDHLQRHINTVHEG